MCLGSFPGPGGHWRMTGRFWARSPPALAAAGRLLSNPSRCRGVNRCARVCFRVVSYPPGAAAASCDARSRGRCDLVLSHAPLMAPPPPQPGTPLAQLPPALQLSASARARLARRCLHSRGRAKLACGSCGALKTLRMATPQVRPRPAPRLEAPQHTLPDANEDVCRRRPGFRAPALRSSKPSPSLSAPGRAPSAKRVFDIVHASPKAAAPPERPARRARRLGAHARGGWGGGEEEEEEPILFRGFGDAAAAGGEA